ncbi:histidine kinase dimerization/phosphoacceptor domain -containing protein [Candidatus Lokiarchaeum ossiferum]|uniref:histidine kinase dimerization/phosphoacceptor domain -containing protein n=1 Tax=Candidatus Lokiarchaeum ossiferum TaxID=2951803 RepID=UPI00352E53D1
MPTNLFSQIDSSRILFDISPNPQVLLNKKYLIVEVNEEFSKVMGYSKEEMLNNPVSSIFANIQEYIEASALFTRDNKLKNFEMIPKIADGSIQYMLLNIRQIIDQRQDFLGYLLTFTEYTAIKNVMEYTRLIIETSPNPQIFLNINNEISDLNKQLLKVTGYKRKDLIGNPVSIVFRDHEQYRAANIILRKEGQLKDFEMIPKSRDGTIFHMLLNIKPMIDKNETVLGSLLTFTDITSLRKAIEVVEQITGDVYSSNTLEERTINSQPKNNQQDLASINQIKMEAELKKRSHDLDERIKELQCLYGIDKILENEGLSVNEIFQNIVSILPAGWQFPEITRAKIEFDGIAYISAQYINTNWKQRNNIRINGEIRGYIEVFYLKKMPNASEGPFLREERHLIDAITERIETVFEKKLEEKARKQAEEKLQEHARRLENSLKEKEVLLSEIHHRVKNNLQLIFSLILLQEQYVTDEKLQLMYRDFKNRVKAMSQIHETLYSSGDITKINFNAYIQEIITNLIHSYYIETNVVKLDISIEQIDISFNKTILCGLIVNEVVSNVLKYAFPDNKKGKLKVKIRKNKKNGNITINIQDNGVGFPPEFDYLKTDTLGLRIVTSLSKQLKGSISMKNENGVKFNLSFQE